MFFYQSVVKWGNDMLTILTWCHPEGSPQATFFLTAYDGNVPATPIFCQVMNSNKGGNCLDRTKHRKR